METATGGAATFIRRTATPPSPAITAKAGLPTQRFATTCSRCSERRSRILAGYASPTTAGISTRLSATVVLTSSI